MRHRMVVLAGGLALAAATAMAVAATTPEPVQIGKAERAAILQLSPIGELPPDPTDGVADDPEAAHFGQYLFFDPNLSANHKVSCSTCHQPDKAFQDGRRVGIGIGIGIGHDTRNTPTLLNAAYNHWFFWDGRADSMWAQPLYVMETPAEFDSDRTHIAHVIFNTPALRKAYEQIFGKMPPLEDKAQFPAHAMPVPGKPDAPLSKAWEAMTPGDRSAVNRVFSNLGKSLEAYERRLASSDSPFDQFVAGIRTGNVKEEHVISAEARAGLVLFVGPAHCALCHSGPRFTDGQFHDLGLPVLPGEKPDIGREGGIRAVKADIFNGTGPYSDDRTGAAKQKLEFLPPPDSQRGKFKTPTLRNVARSAPYAHDGRFKTLKEVVKFYAEGAAASHGHLVGKREVLLDIIPHLKPAQIDDIVAFLRTLSGKPLPHALRVQPPAP